MKNLFYSLGAAAILLSSCSPKPEYTISGTVANADLNGKSVILYEYGQDKPVALDSAIVENGAFTFKGTTATPKLAEISFAPDVVEPVRTAGRAHAPHFADRIGREVVVQQEVRPRIAVQRHVRIGKRQTASNTRYLLGCFRNGRE